MILAVFLYSLYPPFTNLLLRSYSPLQLALVLHTFAAIAVTIFLAMSRRLRGALSYCISRRNPARRPMLVWVAASGVMIVANHLLFYIALAQSEKFDVTAILVFETWPILFFLLDTAMTRGVRTTLRFRDYLMVFISFFGYAILMIQEFDITDWLLVDESIYYVVGFSFLGGLAMTINTFARRRAMLTFRNAETGQIAGNLDGFQASIVVEALVRVTASALLLITFLASGQTFQPLSLDHAVIAFLVGGVALAGGSALYDLGIFRAPNAAIAALWYLMPVGSLLVLGILQGRLINQYEAIASVLIISANILISLRYTLVSSFNLLYIFTLVAGLWCIFIPGSAFREYFDLIAVSTIFYALLTTYALSRIADNSREKEFHLLQFQRELRAARATPMEPETRDALRSYAEAIVAILTNSQRRLTERLTATRHARELRASLVSTALGQHGRNDGLLSLASVADRLVTLVEDRISGGEYVVMTMLATLNVGLIIVLRGNAIALDVFALTVAAAAAYLLLLIYERDHTTLTRYDHYLTLKGILDQLRLLGSDDPDRSTPAARTFGATLERLKEQKTSFALSLSVFVFVFLGFIYALSYQDLITRRRPENSPIGLTADSHDPGVVGIAAPNWPSARMKAEVLSAIAERFLGIDVAIYAADNQTIFEAMGSARGQIDIHPEVWVENVPDLIRRYVLALETVKLTDVATVGRQGLCTNRAAIDRGFQPSIQSLSEPESISIFDLDSDGRGEFWIGAADWASTGIEAIRAQAYGFDADFDPLVFDEPLFVAALRQYNATQTPFLFYCYSPHFVIEGFEAIRVSEAPSDPALWDAIVAAQDPTIDPPSDGTAWPDTQIKVAYSARIATRFPNLAHLLENFLVPDDILGQWTYRMVIDDVPPEVIADEWVRENEEQVLRWLLP